MGDKINLIGHDNTKKWLEKIDETHYRLCGELIDYSRFVTAPDSEIFYSVDPPGGPMLFVDSNIPNTDVKIKKITTTDKDIIIEIYDSSQFH